jgi:hypothetical protein
MASRGDLSQIQGTFGSISDDVIQGSRIGDINYALAERDSALAERDSALAERDSALAERRLILNSRIWVIFSPYRKVKKLFQRI